MPYSQTHLLAASHLLEQSAIRKNVPWLFDDALVQAAFFFGAIAPDAHIFSEQPRESTHFFSIPPQPGVTSPRSMFEQWPTISDPTDLSPSACALVAGCITHLLLDEIWVEDVVLPCLYIDGLEWEPGHPNWGVYNLLVAYLEFHALHNLPNRIPELLQQAEVKGVLPFIEDSALIRWRDRIATQLRERPRATIYVLARTCDLDSVQLEELLTSEEKMNEAAFSIASKDHLHAFQENSARHILSAVINYAAGKYRH